MNNKNEIEDKFKIDFSKPNNERILIKEIKDHKDSQKKVYKINNVSKFLMLVGTPFIFYKMVIDKRYMYWFSILFIYNISAFAAGLPYNLNKIDRK
jgi:hypothetical protein